ncbi:IS66 family transposase [Leptolyngbya sp. PCC 6406]|uniref:IS66 family transposase n=1 Tax=Leptolyngbya sp. PCC 6406 TaxID=1173264 RepID=UPI0004871839|nr:IS66 family transposase [Leptolyngbya sp. PCC 6406]
MSEGNEPTIDIGGISISVSDWDATPASVKKALVCALIETISRLEERVSHLEEQLNQNSQNSSLPPSKDGFGPPKPDPEGKGKGKRKRGGQPGHKGYSRKLYPLEACKQVFEHRPKTCGHCGEPLSGNDPAPYRHQIVELPPIEPIVIEHRLHALDCEHCGKTTRSKLPAEVHQGGYGERLSAVVALLSGAYRQSHQQVKTCLAALFEIEISGGSINRLRREASAALGQPVAEAQGYVQGEAVIHSDETSFRQGNSDGQNQAQRQGWLWVLVTPMVSVFSILLSRSQAAAQALIGPAYDGIVVSDRYSGYGWIDISQRQVCWAHLKRDFTRIAERQGVCQEIGKGLLAQQKALFELWYQVRDGTLSRTGFAELVQPIRAAVKAVLEEGANYDIGPKEKTPLAKTVRTCRQLLLVEPALWTFVTVLGVEPTNNTAERSLRAGVIWKRISFGAESQAGSEFVARMLTTVSSLTMQQRDVLDFLTQAYWSARFGQPPPSLLPLATHQPQTLITP